MALWGWVIKGTIGVAESVQNENETSGRVQKVERWSLCARLRNLTLHKQLDCLRSRMDELRCGLTYRLVDYIEIDSLILNQTK